MNYKHGPAGWPRRGAQLGAQLGAMGLLALAALVARADSDRYIDVSKAAAQGTDASDQAFFRELEAMHQALAKVSGIKSRLLLSDSDEVNAFATEAEGEKLIVLNMGLVDALGDDRDALVSVLAHEYAHHGKSHLASTKSTNSLFGVLGVVVGAVIDYKLGTGGLGQDIGGAGAKVITRSFSRDQEREADATGLQWMVDAGYNPAGAVRAQRKFLEMAGSSGGFSLFRTHPGSDERVVNLQGLIAANVKAQALQSDQKVALALPSAEQDDEEADESEGQAVAAFTEPPAALLEPVQGTSLAGFAQISNDIVFMGEAKALARHKLSASRYAQINDGWTARMRGESGHTLTGAYSAHYFEASQGRFAAWGKDVAQAMRSGRLAQATEPVPVDDWAALVQAQRQAVKDGQYDAAAFERAVRAKGMTSYDFNIVNSWWMQRARERAAQGDTSLYQKLG
jgi:Zn-dependent protease with chaperone function